MADAQPMTKLNRQQQVRMTDQQYVRWTREAQRRGLTLSAWLRMLASDAAPVVQERREKENG